MAENIPQNVPEVDLGDAVRGLSGGQFVFNRYSLVKLLGRGRTSAVWQAWDDKESRDVALKFLPVRVAQDAEALADIKRAADQMATVDVPQVARIYGLEVEGKLAAVAEQLIEGDSLHALRGQKKSQVFDAVDLKEWLKQIISTLQALHAAGRCHGNLKPTNLLLTPNGQLVITDAALDAKVGYWVNKLEGSPRDVSQSARYASPQQLAGQELAVTDDVYSLGVCLYELITSKPPFNAGNIVAQVKEDLPPSMTRRRRDLRILGEPIPRAWDETVAACLAKEPEARPQDMAEVADRLELYGPSKRAAAAVAPNPAALAAAAAAIAAAPAPAAPSPTAGLPGMPGAKPAAKKSLVPVIAVIAGVVIGVGGWYVSTQLGKSPGNLTFNPEGNAPKTNAEVSPEDLERRLEYEKEALRRKFEEERAKIEQEKKLQEEELEKRKAALAAATAAAKKAQEEVEARQRQAEEEARKLQAEAEARQREIERKAQEDAKRIAAEREALRQKEEEIKKAAAAAAQQTETAEAKAERLRREKEFAEQQAALAKLQEEAEKARQAAEAVKAAAELAAKKAAEEKAALEAAARKAAEEKAAAELAAKKAAEEEAARKAALEKKVAEAERQRLLAEAENRRKLEEAARRAEMEREIKMAKLTEDARRLEEAKRAKAEEERKAREAQLLAQASAVADRPGSGVWHNSIGMRMVPLGEIYICAWETRLEDFEEFARDTRYNASLNWKSPGFKQGATHPVVNVNFDDALAFCNWLTGKERKAGIIAADQLYRLPTDSEWSRAAQLGTETGATPEDRSGRLAGQYPWGTVWPPPPGAGNYSDGVSFDPYDFTAPVASFMPNQLGLFDLGGNVWEWCMDWGDAGQKQRVLRGGSFFGYVPGTLGTSYRLLLDGKERRYDNGFRIVLAK